MNNYLSILERFENSSTHDNFYYMQKSNGKCALYTQSARDTWAENHFESIHYFYDDELLSKDELLVHVAQDAFCHIDEALERSLLEKRQFTLYPFCTEAPVFETHATALDIAIYFSSFIAELENVGPETIKHEPGIYAIAQLLETRCKGLPEAKIALQLLESILSEDTSEEGSRSPTSIDSPISFYTNFKQTEGLG